MTTSPPPTAESATPFHLRGRWLAYRWAWGPVISVIIVAGFALKLAAEWAELRTAVGRELQTHADLKSRQLADWREERLGEARFLSLAPGVARDVAALLATPDSATARQDVSQWLTSLKGGDRYESALLLDATLRPRIAVPADAPPPSAFLRDAANAVLTDGNIRLTDLHRAHPDGPVHLDVIAPIFAPPAGTGTGSPGRPIALAVLRLRPEQKLYPLLHAWPRPSDTAEAMLVHIEGDSVVQLSPIRHGAQKVLQQRWPLEMTRFAAGVSEEARHRPAVWQDYRGQSVISVIRPVPNSPWFIIVKIDTQEAYAPLRRAAWQTALGAVMLIVAVFLTIGYTSSHLDRRRLRQELQGARENAESAERQALLSNEANDLIILVGPEGRLVEANPRALAVYGYTSQEFRQLTVSDIRPAGLRSLATDDMRRVAADGSAVFETVHVRKDGSQFPVEVSSRRIQLGGKGHYLSVVRDITERKRTEDAQRERQRLEDQLTKVAASVPGIIYSFRLHPDGRSALPYCNDRIEDIWGFRAADLRDDFTPATSRIHPADLEVTATCIRESAATLQPWRSCFRILHPVRGELWVEGHAVPQREPDGSILWHGYIQDVTEREQSRHAIVEREERLRLALAAANQGLFDLNLQTGETQVSPEYATMLGYEPATFVETRTAWLGRMHPEDREHTERAYRDYLAGRTAEFRAEFRQQTRGGGWKWILSVGRIVAFTAEGQPVRLLGTHTDIAHQKATESALRESEDRYRGLVESSFDWVWECDAEGRYSFVSPRIRDLLGIEPGEVLGRTPFDFLAGDEAARTELAAFISTRQPFRLELAHRHNSGRTVILETSGIPVLSREGGLRGYRGIARDITARREAERALRLRSAALEAAANAVVLSDRHGNIEWANPAFTSLSGWELAEVLGRNPRDFLKSGSHDAAFYGGLWSTITGGRVWRGEIVNRRKDGSLRTEEMTITPLHDEKGELKHFIAVKQDITEQKEIESQLQQRQRIEAIGTLAGGIAHDLNNILSPILIVSNVLRERITDAEELEILDMAQSSAQRGADIVRQLLTFSRGQQGEKSQLQARHLVRELLGMMQSTFPRDITLHSHVASDLWTVVADPTQLHQVLLNLAVNARDAMEQGGRLSLNTRNVQVTPEDPALPPGFTAGPYVIFEVQDTGHGIPPEIRQRIFDPFFTTKPLGKGTGMGLSTVLGIVRAHGGFITVDSAPGQGTTFRVYLPASPDSSVHAPAAAPVPAARGTGQTILIVDDESHIRAMTRRLLEGNGYQVLTASDGAEAATLYQKHRVAIALVLTDIMMPVMNGMALIRVLRSLDPHLNIIATSGAAEASLGQELRALGVPDLLAKPVNPDVLLALIGRLMGSGAPPSE